MQRMQRNGEYLKMEVKEIIGIAKSLENDPDTELTAENFSEALIGYKEEELE